MVLAPFTTLFPLDGVGDTNSFLPERTNFLSHSLQQLDRIDSLSEQVGFLEERIGACKLMCVYETSVQSVSIDQISNIFIRCLPGELDDQRWAGSSDTSERKRYLRSPNEHPQPEPLKHVQSAHKHNDSMSNTQTPVWIQLSCLAHELALGYFTIFLYPLLSFISWCKYSCMVSPSLSQEKCKFTYL